jgi:catechol 2,3-dioxygenase-like lactoylglutathione lyase family enzyme
MLQHVSLEVPPERVPDCLAFWELLGFAPLDPPPKLRSRFTWVEREGTQIHLIPAEDPSGPAREGHVAVVAEDYERALGALRGAGFEPFEGENAWDAPRSFVRDPAGHLVEVMSRAPQPPWPAE